MINSARTSQKKRKSSDSVDDNIAVSDIKVDFVEKNLDNQHLKNLMHFGDTREPTDNVYNLEGFESNSKNVGSYPKDMIIINNQGKQTETQENHETS